MRLVKSISARTAPMTYENRPLIQNPRLTRLWRGIFENFTHWPSLTKANNRRRRRVPVWNAAGTPFVNRQPSAPQRRLAASFIHEKHAITIEWGMRLTPYGLNRECQIMERRKDVV